MHGACADRQASAVRGSLPGFRSRVPAVAALASKTQAAPPGSRSPGTFLAQKEAQNRGSGNTRQRGDQCGGSAAASEFTVNRVPAEVKKAPARQRQQCL